VKPTAIEKIFGAVILVIDSDRSHYKRDSLMLVINYRYRITRQQLLVNAGQRGINQDFR